MTATQSTRNVQPRWLIYCRICSDPTHKGLGVARQENACRALVDQIGGTIVGVFRDNDVSAYTGRRRPQYEAMLAAVEDGQCDALMAWHPDRLHRSALELEHFIDVVERHKTKVLTVQAGPYDLSTPAGRMTARIVGAVARGESEFRSARIRAKMDELAATGKPHGGGRSRPYGFMADRITHNPPEATMLRLMCAKLLEGDSIRSVAAWMNNHGAVSSGGKPWSPTMVRDAALNPRNAGLRARGKRGDTTTVAKAVWEPIIDMLTHDRLRALLLDPDRRTNQTSRDYLLSGLLVCQRCGAPLLASARSGRVDADEHGLRRYYRCAAIPGRPGCGRNLIRAKELEQHVADLVLAHIRADNAITGYASISPDSWVAMSFRERRALVVALVDRIVIDPPHRPSSNTFENARIHTPAWRSGSAGGQTAQLGHAPAGRLDQWVERDQVVSVVSSVI